MIHAQNRERFGDERIDGYENTVRIPTAKHLDLNGWYARSNTEYGDLSPRDYLRGKSWEQQMTIALRELRKRGIVKP